MNSQKAMAFSRGRNLICSTMYPDHHITGGGLIIQSEPEHDAQGELLLFVKKHSVN